MHSHTWALSETWWSGILKEEHDLTIAFIIHTHNRRTRTGFDDVELISHQCVAPHPKRCERQGLIGPFPPLSGLKWSGVPDGILLRDRRILRVLSVATHKGKRGGGLSHCTSSEYQRQGWGRSGGPWRVLTTAAERYPKRAVPPRRHELFVVRQAMVSLKSTPFSFPC